MTLVLVRHGESAWNAEGLFCGWCDVELSNSASSDSLRASTLIQQYMDDDNEFDICYASVLKRSIKTAHFILECIDALHIPIKKSWRLNERFYGALTGKKKVEMVEKYGKQQILKWRRSYNDPPPEINKNDALNPIYDHKYYRLTDFDIDRDFPSTEALSHVIERIKPLWYNEIVPLLKQECNILICLHGTSMRAIISLIEKEYQKNNVDFNTLSQLEIPNGYPVAYTFDKDGNIVVRESDAEDKWIDKQQKVIKIAKIHGRFLGSLDNLLTAQKKVKNQIEKK